MSDSNLSSAYCLSRTLQPIQKTKHAKTTIETPDENSKRRNNIVDVGFTSLAIKTQPSSFHILDLGPGNGGVRRVAEQILEKRKI